MAARSLTLALVSLLLTLPALSEQAALATQSSAASGSSNAGAAFPAQPSPMDTLRELLSSAPLPLPQIVTERFEFLKRFYGSRGYAPLWTGATSLDPAGEALFTRLRAIAVVGPASLSPLLAEATKRAGYSGVRPLAELELLLSAAFVGAAIDPNDPAASAEQPEALIEIATTANVIALLRDRLPTDPAFWRLRTSIQAYRGIEAKGGWPIVPAAAKLELGVTSSGVALLRERLLVTGDIAEIGAPSDNFDSAVDAAVRRFQARHGLQVDGIVGKDTIAALNIPVVERLAIMDVNLRRLQQQRREWGQRYLVVNTAAATYRLFDRGQQVFERVAIVGRRGWSTPQLDSVIDRIEFNPYWVVPPRIARLEVLPKTRREPDYMLRNDMHWVNGQIRQDPGPKNPLGKVKFLFLNPYDVYLHDTNSPKLFERWDRHLSHGCMRISAALDLAGYLLKDDPSWPLQRIQGVVESGRTVRVGLTAPIPLHVVYDTAWVDDAGIINFRPDAYGRDSDTGIAVADSASNRQRRCAA